MRLNSHKLLLYLAAILLTGVMANPFPASAFFGGKVKNFSADQVTIFPDGKKMGSARLYVTPDAFRMDGMPGGGGQMGAKNITFLGFPKQDKQYIYNHDQKLFFESRLDQEEVLQDLKSYQNAESVEVLGKEKVSGYICEKKRVTTTMTVMGMQSTTTQIIWQSDRFDFPLRVQEEDGQIMEFRNIQTGKPDKKLFRRPAGYKQVNSMMAAMGMDFSAMAKERSKQRRQDRRADPKAPDQANIEDMMKNMEQMMGPNADPEQMAQMKQVMSQAMNRARQTKEGKGAADGLWKIIPQRRGDRIGHEMKTVNLYNVVLGTRDSLQEVFDFYRKQLQPKGWQDAGMFLQDGKGTFSMMKGQQMMTIAWADNPGMDGNYSVYYNVQLSGPDI